MRATLLIIIVSLIIITKSLLKIQNKRLQSEQIKQGEPVVMLSKEPEKLTDSSAHFEITNEKSPGLLVEDTKRHKL